MSVGRNRGNVLGEGSKEIFQFVIIYLLVIQWNRRGNKRTGAYSRGFRKRAAREGI